MKNIALILLAAALLVSCKDESYTGTLETEGLDKITLITLSPNNPQLIADGCHELTFKVKAFMDVEYTRRIERIVDNQSVFSDSTYTTRTQVRADRLDPADFTITASTGETLSGLTYTTTQTGTVTFTAKYGNLTSAPQTVEMIAAPAQTYQERVIPVIFHTLIYSGNAKVYELYDTEYFQTMLDKTNAVFAGTVSPDPMATDSKVRFVLATRDPNGIELANRGINRVELPATVTQPVDVGNWLKETTILSNVEVPANLNKVVWDTERYLNIWCGTLETIPQPAYILSGSGVTAPQGLALTSVADEAAAYNAIAGNMFYWFYGPAGLALPVTPTHEPGSIAFELGRFFGLLSTSVVTRSTGPSQLEYMNDDYLDDTPPTYEYGDAASRETSIWVEGQNPYTYTGPTVDFDKYNVMTGGRMSSFTPDQVARMRLVMENCPLRMMKQ